VWRAQEKVDGAVMGLMRMKCGGTGLAETLLEVLVLRGNGRDVWLFPSTLEDVQGQAAPTSGKCP
jgi:hypothetical protein